MQLSTLQVSLFRIFGVIAFGFGVSYAIFHGFFGRKIDQEAKVNCVITPTIIKNITQ